MYNITGVYTVGYCGQIVMEQVHLKGLEVNKNGLNFVYG